MRNKNDMVACSHCSGTGKVQLTGQYAETLVLLRRNKHEISGAALAFKANCEPTAMNNRLAALERMGLAESRRYGRLRLYKAI